MMDRDYTLYKIMNFSLDEILTYDIVSNPSFLKAKVIFLEVKNIIER